MSLTVFNPSPSYTDGNILVIIAPAVASATLATATMAEVNAGTSIACAIEEMGWDVDAQTTTRKKLCHSVAQQAPGSRTYTAPATVIAHGDPQSAAPLFATLAEDAVVYVISRLGLPYSTAPASAQKVIIDRRRVLTNTVTSVTTQDGEEFTRTITWLVEARNLTAAITA